MAGKRRSAVRRNPVLRPPVLTPSQANIIRWSNGDTGALPFVLRDFLGRAVIIGAGLWLAGCRDPKQLTTYGFAGAGAIDLFLAIHTARYNRGVSLEHVDGHVVQASR